MHSTFKSETSFEKRTTLSARIISRHKDRVPVIVEISRNTNLTLSSKKFLAPKDISIAGFLNEIRKQASIGPEQAIFLFCGSAGVLVPTGYTISQVYEKHKDEDGFLYITVALENTFGLLRAVDAMLDEMLTTSSRVSNALGLDNFL